MFPYLFFFIPDARVEIQPPKVENSTESWGLKWAYYWLMSANHAVPQKLSLHIFPDDSAFDAGGHVLSVDPFYLVHPAAIYRDYHSFFVDWQH